MFLNKYCSLILYLSAIVAIHGCQSNSNLDNDTDVSSRERIALNSDWRFFKYSASEAVDNLIYDVRPEVDDNQEGRPADAKPTEAVELTTSRDAFKYWILPTGNKFIKDSTKHFKRPEGNPGFDFPFVLKEFDDTNWEEVNLPHDWVIKGPFYQGNDVLVGGGMGRLPSPGVAWYRKKIRIPNADQGKSIFLDIEGAMSYSMVWLNGHLVGGWPYGYASWRLDLTPFLNFGSTNQLAIRVDNPPNSSRWYPGGGIYRNVWLIKSNPIHVGQWGTYIKTKSISESSAEIDISINIENDKSLSENLLVKTEIFEWDAQNNNKGISVAMAERNVALN